MKGLVFMKKFSIAAAVCAGVAAAASVPVAMLVRSRLPRTWDVERVADAEPLRRIDGDVADLAWTVTADDKDVLVQFVSPKYEVEAIDAAYTKGGILTLEAAAVLLPVGSEPRTSVFRLTGSDPLSIERAVVLRRDANGVSGEAIPFLYAAEDMVGL